MFQIPKRLINTAKVRMRNDMLSKDIVKVNIQIQKHYDNGFKALLP